MFKRQIMIMTILLMPAAFLFTGCGPNPDPVMVDKVNNHFATNSSKTYNGSGKYNPMPLAVGQFVTHGNTDDDGTRSVSRTAIVGKEGRGWILETYSINDHSESCTQMLVVGMENMHTSQGLENLDILWVKIKDENGQIQTIEGPTLMMAKSFYKSALQSFDISAITNQASGADVSVPAGTFKKTFSADAEMSVMGMTFRSTSWFHEKVPVNGMVRSITDGGKMTSVLLDFGKTGAKPCF